MAAAESDRQSLRGLSEAEVSDRVRQDGYNDLPTTRHRELPTITADLLREPTFVPLVACRVFLAVVLSVPVIRDLFRFSFLHPDDLGICLLAGAGPIVVFEGFKSTRRRLRSSS